MFYLAILYIVKTKIPYQFLIAIKQLQLKGNQISHHQQPKNYIK